MTTEFDWESIRHTLKVVECEFTPRASYNGQPLKSELEQLAGTKIQVMYAWRCDPDERYANEHALTIENPSQAWRDALCTWVASGDVSNPVVLSDDIADNILKNRGVKDLCDSLNRIAENKSAI